MAGIKYPINILANLLVFKFIEQCSVFFSWTNLINFKFLCINVALFIVIFQSNYNNFINKIIFWILYFLILKQILPDFRKSRVHMFINAEKVSKYKYIHTPNFQANFNLLTHYNVKILAKFAALRSLVFDMVYSL